MAEVNETLEWENRVVLSVVQALLGFVSTPLRGVAVEIDGGTVILHFAVREIDSEISADIEDVVGDVEGLLWPTEVEVHRNVYQGEAGTEWEGRQHRMVILAK